MAAPLSQDLRKRLVEAVEEGSSARAAAARFQVSPAAAMNIVRRARETGSTAPARIGGYRRPLLADHEALLRDLTTARKGITLAEIRRRAGLARDQAGLAVDDLDDAQATWAVTQKKR